MKDPIEKFVEGAKLLGTYTRMRTWDSYGPKQSWPVTYEIYRSGDRIVRVRRFPVWGKQSFWDDFSNQPREQIGEDYESQIISKDKAFGFLVEAGTPIEKATEILEDSSPQ